VAQVAGVVTAVSPALVAGGFFAPGDALVTIDGREYELAVTAAKADVALRRVAVDLERAEAEVAIASSS
jgi:multidrug resistance efflux pump